MTHSGEPTAAHRARRWAVVALALVTVLVVGRLVLDRGAGSAAAAPPTTHQSPSVRGTVTAEAPGRLSVTTTAGAVVTVTVDGTTAWGTRRAPLDPSAVATGSQVAVVGTLTGSTVLAQRVLVPRTADAPNGAPTTAPAPATTPAPTTAPSPTAVPARCDVSGAAQAAAAVATDAGERIAVAVLDTATGTYTEAGEADTPFSTASVVKVLIATRLLLDGTMTGDTADTAREMVTTSDDDDADALYDLAGGDDVLPSVAAHYGIADLGAPPAEEGQWGETQVTADGLAHLYAALRADPVVWPWLSEAMGATEQTAADGTDQWFGLPAAASSWDVKQGWMVGLGPGAWWHSTGYVDDGRWVVVLLTEATADDYGPAMASTLDTVARTLIPDGVAPGSAC